MGYHMYVWFLFKTYGLQLDLQWGSCFVWKYNNNNNNNMMAALAHAGTLETCVDL